MPGAKPPAKTHRPLPRNGPIDHSTHRKEHMKTKAFTFITALVTLAGIAAGVGWGP